MKAPYHIATVNAFANKFGTYSGAIRNETTNEIIRERFATLDEAINWVRAKAYNMFGPISFAPLRRKNEYLANCWLDI
jgi:hypothetical protein